MTDRHRRKLAAALHSRFDPFSNPTSLGDQPPKNGRPRCDSRKQARDPAWGTDLQIASSATGAVIGRVVVGRPHPYGAPDEPRRRYPPTAAYKLRPL